MSKTKLLGKEKERQLKEQQRAAKLKNKKKRRGPIRYCKDVWQELKKVTWPTKKDLLNSTVAVIVFIVIMAVVTGVFDLILTQIFNLVIK